MTGILIRYHEVALKKGNRPYFVKLLKKNLTSSVRGLGLKEVRKLQARLLLLLSNNVDKEEVRRRVAAVFGVANFSFVERTPVDLKILKSRILESLNGRHFNSFRVETKRGDKTFPFTSTEINREVGAAVKEISGARVDLKNADFVVFIEILSHDAFFGFDKISGPGGWLV